MATWKETNKENTLTSGQEVQFSNRLRTLNEEVMQEMVDFIVADRIESGK